MARYTAEFAGALERRWQRYWSEHRVHHQPDPGSPGFDPQKPKFYGLDMFPYPSGQGLHVGHPKGFTAMDIVCRYQRMRGANVLHPIGWDAFGLPAEQHAIKSGIHPEDTTEAAIERFRAQLKRLGIAYDHAREFSTTDPEYYRFTQLIFLKIYGAWFDPQAQSARKIDALIEEFSKGRIPIRFNPHAQEVPASSKARRFAVWTEVEPQTQRAIVDSWRLAYRASCEVNWCPQLGTVLANEEVIEGRSERGGHPVQVRTMMQWSLRITAYAKRLQDGLQHLDWPEGTKASQANWIEAMRDWVFSRQRYWGEPIPIAYDEAGRAYEVDEEALPVCLPQLEHFAPIPAAEPRAMLSRSPGFVNTTAAEAGVGGLPPETPMTRETCTMPNWAGSSWYYLRFAGPPGSEACDYWTKGGVDLYMGGAEQSVLHLLYARFWHQVLFDLGWVNAPEPFERLFHQGLIQSFVYRSEEGHPLSADEVAQVEEAYVEKKSGRPVVQVRAKMGKSLNNAVSPDAVIDAYSADTLRIYLMSMGPLAAAQPWTERGLRGAFRFLQRAWRLIIDEESGALKVSETSSEAIDRTLRETVLEVEAAIERLAMNIAIAKLNAWVRRAQAHGVTREQSFIFCRILAPFAPHITEELASRLGGRTALIDEDWPKVQAPASGSYRLVVQVQGKRRAQIEVASGASWAQIRSMVLKEPAVAKRCAGRTVARIVHVPGRLVNVVLD